MGIILQIIKDVSEKLGISQYVILVHFSITAVLEFLALKEGIPYNMKLFFSYTPVLMLLFYFPLYFLFKNEKWGKFGFFTDKPKTLILNSVFYSIISFTVATGISGAMINVLNNKMDSELYHASETLGLAIGTMEQSNIGSDHIDYESFHNLLEEGFIWPLENILEANYNKETEPVIQLLPRNLPQTLKASLLGEEIEYSKWAKHHGYDLIIYGQAQKGGSDKLLLDIDFDILKEAKTVQVKQSHFNLNYTISNYDTDTLIASFDNMVNIIAGISLYLDEKYEKSQEVFETSKNSLERELADYSEEKAQTEIERKKFSLKRKKIEQNLGIVSFYLGNVFLLSGQEQMAEDEYKKAQSYIESTSSVKLTSATGSLKTISNEVAVMNNLSISYVSNKKYDLAEEVLVGAGAENSEDVILAQNLGLLYLEQSLPEQNIEEEVEDQTLESDSSEAKNQTDKEEKREKAKLIFEKLEKKLKKEELKQEKNPIAKMALKNNYHNKGVLSLVEKDFDRAKECFKNELEIISEMKNKNEKKKILTEKKKINVEKSSVSDTSRRVFRKRNHEKIQKEEQLTIRMINKLENRSEGEELQFFEKGEFNSDEDQEFWHYSSDQEQDNEGDFNKEELEEEPQVKRALPKEPYNEEEHHEDKEHYEEKIPIEEYYEEKPPAEEEYHEEKPPAEEEYHEEKPPAEEERYEEKPPAEEEYHEEKPPAEEEYHEEKSPAE